MHNWSTNLNRLKKNPDAYERYVLEQRINFGLNGYKLSIASLKKHWLTLNIDPNKQRFLKSLLWPKS